MELLGKVRNGNYDILMFTDGTKIRQNDLDCFIPEKPESMDIKITDRCDKGCPFCHENSTPTGYHGDIFNAKFIDTLLPYTELALGGGNPLEHPDLIPFLQKCKKKSLIPNITINQTHFIKKFDLVKRLVDNQLIYGLGISLVEPTKDFIDKVKQFPNAVIHVINGVHTVETLQKLYDQGLKILILGYKYFRRGKQYYSEEVEFVKEQTRIFLPEILEHFDVVSFDNLALEQLKVKDLISEDEWNEIYMGDDGQFTCYIDVVRGEYALNSTSEERFPLLDDIKPMFDHLREIHDKQIKEKN